MMMVEKSKNQKRMAAAYASLRRNSSVGTVAPEKGSASGSPSEAPTPAKRSREDEEDEKEGKDNAGTLENTKKSKSDSGEDGNHQPSLLADQVQLRAE
jgi:hypothetical protein